MNNFKDFLNESKVVLSRDIDINAMANDKNCFDRVSANINSISSEFALEIYKQVLDKLKENNPDIISVKVKNEKNFSYKNYSLKTYGGHSLGSTDHGFEIEFSYVYSPKKGTDEVPVRKGDKINLNITAVYTLNTVGTSAYIEFFVTKLEGEKTFFQITKGRVGTESFMRMKEQLAEAIRKNTDGMLHSVYLPWAQKQDKHPTKTSVHAQKFGF